MAEDSRVVWFEDVGKEDILGSVAREPTLVR